MTRFSFSIPYSASKDLKRELRLRQFPHGYRGFDTDATPPYFYNCRGSPGAVQTHGPVTGLVYLGLSVHQLILGDLS